MKSGGHSYKSMTLVYVSLARATQPAVSIINHAMIGCRPSGAAAVRTACISLRKCCSSLSLLHSFNGARRLRGVDIFGESRSRSWWLSSSPMIHYNKRSFINTMIWVFSCLLRGKRLEILLKHPLTVPLEEKAQRSKLIGEKVDHGGQPCQTQHNFMLGRQNICKVMWDLFFFF